MLQPTQFNFKSYSNVCNCYCFLFHLPFLTLETATPHMLVGCNTPTVFLSLLLGKISYNCNYWYKTPGYFTDFSSFLLKQHLIDSESLFHFKWLIKKKNIYYGYTLYTFFFDWKMNYVGKMQDQFLNIWRAESRGMCIFKG